MATKAAVDAIEARLAAGVALPVVGINLVGAAPTDNTAYLLVQYPVTNGEAITVGAPGSNIYRDTGVARVVIHVPSGTGTGEALTIADQICALFRGAQFDGVRCWAPTIGPIDDRNDQGAYYLLTVAIPYQFDHYA